MLSREPTPIPEAEARSLVSDLDREASFDRLEEGLLVAETCADPELIGSRIAFARRVGVSVPDGELDSEALELLRKGPDRVRVFGDNADTDRDRAIVSAIADQVKGKVSLESPDYEVSAYVSHRSDERYFALTRPSMMRQGWSTRRPRSRAFFHPSAIFPKLSRALVNFSGVQPGEVFLDPFCGTGSLLIEASLIGVEAAGIDFAKKMVRGARRNSMKYSQPWLGIVRGDSRELPVRQVDGIATDIPYGRAASSGGVESSQILSSLVEGARAIIPKGRKLVVMHPKSLGVDAAGFDVESELDIYIHRAPYKDDHRDEEEPMTKLEVVFLGTSSATPTKGRNLPAIAVRREGEVVLLDCGEGTQKSFVEYGLGINKEMVVLITHMHGDHVNGLLGLLQTMSMSQRGKRLTLVGARGPLRLGQDEHGDAEHRPLFRPPVLRSQAGCRLEEQRLSHQVRAREPLDRGVVLHLRGDAPPGGV